MVKTTVKIEGMMCGMCEAHMNDAFRKNFKIKKVTSSHSKNETVITSVSPLDAEEIKKVVDETGYKFVSVSSEEC
ncbi:MAG: heavy-metal-associated domain-containing protein [Clostridia bacterium]|nr:heavy-metal-associated domain-containing protein [Clostridia bacterium]